MDATRPADTQRDPGESRAGQDRAGSEPEPGTERNRTDQTCRWDQRAPSHVVRAPSSSSFRLQISFPPSAFTLLSWFCGSHPIPMNDKAMIRDA